jgi:hypothetical protein
MVDDFFHGGSPAEMAVPVIVAVSRAGLYAAGQAAAILPTPAFALDLFFVLAAALPFALDFALATAELFLILAGVMAVIVTPVRVSLATFTVVVAIIAAPMALAALIFPGIG